MQGDILVAALNGHHGVGHLHGLGNADVSGAVFGGNGVEGAGGAGKGLPHGNIDDVAARVDKQIAVVRGQTFKSQFPVTQAASLGAELEPVGHVFLIH